MSIENFFANNPADSEFTQAVSWERSNGASPVGFMANILTKEGRNGLRPLGNAVSSGDIESAEILYKHYFANSAAIFLGVSLLSIEDILREGQFDQETFNARTKMAHTGTYISPELFTNPICEAISSANYKTFVQTATEDKTFASFFRREFISLPESLQEILERHRLIMPIRDYLLPRYEERIKLLVPPSGQQVAI